MAHRKTNTLVLLVLLIALSCKKASSGPEPNDSNYPDDIAGIIIPKCATAGCHNNASYINAAGLNLTTWDDMFKGSGTGAVAIPFRPDFSTLCFYTNTDTSIGMVLQPTMPYAAPPLSKEEYSKIRDWIASGAPDASGRIKFTDTPSRRKYYITNRLCDLVTVIDAASLLQMRQVDVGNGLAQFPYCIKVAPDKKRWYVTFFSQSRFIQQFSADDDKLLCNIEIGTGAWGSLAITADSRHAWAVDNSSPGKLAYIDLEKGTLIASFSFNGKLEYPSGIALNEQLQKLYIGVSSGNFIYNIDISDPFEPAMTELPIDGTIAVQHTSGLDAAQLLATVQDNKCFLACGASGEVRIMDMQHDKLMGTIPLGSLPAMMDYSPATQKLFVSCPNDAATFPGSKGSVAVIDINTKAIVTKINTGYQPYGLAVDDEHDIVVVANANISSGGPASHHASRCGKKNGNVTFIDMNTLSLIPRKKLEVAVFPYGAAAR